MTCPDCEDIKDLDPYSCCEKHDFTYFDEDDRE